MRLFSWFLLFFIIPSVEILSQPVTRYVSPAGNNTAPYTSWATAATDFQSAINQSADGDLILAGNGTYTISSSISVTKGITIRSQNGPAYSTIDGNNSVLCLYINNTNAVIDGFTITKGYNPYGFGGGVNIASGGTLKNCIVSYSQARDGGGVAIDNSGIVENCIIKANKADNTSGNGYGGGVRMLEGGITRGCLVYGNSSVDLGGGINIWDAGSIQNCTITNNTAPNGAGVRCRGNSIMENTISYFNNGDNWVTEGSSFSFSNNCTTPELTAGTGNITGDPLFVNAGAENFYLSAASPCIEKGLNDAWMTTASDLNGNNRIFNGTVDIGAYEFTTFIISSSASAGGVISPSGNTAVNLGNSLTYTITPNAGYSIQDVVVDGVSKGAITTFTFTNVTSGHTISASFKTSQSNVLLVPTQSWPIGGAVVYTNTPTLYWYLGGSSIGLTYRVKYSTDPNNSGGNVQILEAGNLLQLTLPLLQPGTTYYWQVMSTDLVNSSAYSPIASFKTTGGSVVTTPEIPIPAWPVNGATVYLPGQTLSWYTLSGGSNIASYTVKWGEGSSLSNVISGITSLVTQITGLLPGHTYSWTVESVDKSGNHSLPSEAETFVTAGGSANKPSTPVQAWPIGGAMVYTDSPALVWYNLQATFGITDYKIRYSKNPDMSSYTELHQSGSLITLTLTGLEKGMTYYWQVQSSDGHVYSDPQTPPASFVVYSDNNLYTPTALSPTGRVGISSNSVQLSWANLNIDEPVTYNLQYSTNPEFKNSTEVLGLSESSFKADNLINGKYYWRVQSKTQDGELSSYSPVGKFTVNSSKTLITEKEINPEEFALLQNYPNPFNPTTSIAFNLPKESDVTVEAFDAIGKFVAQIYKGMKPKGFTQLEFNAGNLPSGIYFYKIIAVDLNGNMNCAIKKMIILK